jgi:hypothetical protein
MKQDGSWAKINQEKTDIFAKHFVKVFTPNTREISPEEKKTIFNHQKSTKH